MTSISEIVARAMLVGRLEIQLSTLNSHLARRQFQKRLDAATTLLVEALAERHVYTWNKIDTSYRDLALWEMEKFLDDLAD